MCALVFNIPTSAKVIWRQGHCIFVHLLTLPLNGNPGLKYPPLSSSIINCKGYSVKEGPTEPPCNSIPRSEFKKKRYCKVENFREDYIFTKLENKTLTPELHEYGKLFPLRVVGLEKI